MSPDVIFKVNKIGNRMLTVIHFNNIIKNVEKSILFERICYDRSLLSAKEKATEPTFYDTTFTHIYASTVYEFFSYVDMHKNKILEMTTDEMNNINYNIADNALLSVINERKNQTISSKVSKLYTCSECNRSETFITEVQLRSADEGKTTIITCSYCSHEWRIEA